MTKRARSAKRRPRALGALRRLRGRSAGELAFALELDLRSYERLEAGEITLTVERLLAIVALCQGDAPAVLCALTLEAPRLALMTADNQLFTALAQALVALPEEAALRMAALAPEAVTGAVQRFVHLLAQGEAP